jgi:predicted nucleotide-binding protein
VAQKQRSKVPANPGVEPELLVPTSQMNQELEVQTAQGREFLEQAAALLAKLQAYTSIQSDYIVLRDKFRDWDEYNEQLLRSRFSTGKLADSYQRKFLGISGSSTEKQELDWLTRDINGQLRKLGSIRQRLNLYRSVETSAAGGGSLSPSFGDKIFIVHGHDGDTKLQVAEFVERTTGERPVILHEQADSGRTVIEKFEEHASEAGFAIILLTADDEGKAKGVTQLNPRARQNVVLEFGYFMAKLGRGRVVALYEAGVELPSDVSGVLYKSLAGNWHTELARELKAAGIEIDFSKLF